MGEAQDRWDALKGRVTELQNEQDETEARNKRQVQAMYDLANDLTYPADEQGNQMHIHWLIPMLSLHLAKCGYRKIESEAEIKQIVHPRAGAPGVVEDAVLYVPVDATGTVPEAFQRPPEDLPEPPAPPERWKVKTHITVDGETIKGGMR